MINLEYDRERGVKKVIIKGDSIIVGFEATEIIEELCKAGELIASGIAKGVIDAMGEEFVLSCINSARKAKKKLEDIKSKSKSSEEEQKILEKEIDKLLKSLFRGIADE